MITAVQIWSLDFDIQLATAVGPILAVVVAMITVYYSNQNSRQQILVGKLEELYEIIQTTSRHYSTFKLLYPLVKQIVNQQNDEVRTYDEYNESLNEEISESERRQIFISLSRIEVLARCYTKGNIQEKTLEFGQLMYSFADFVFNAGGLQEAHFETGFPSYQEFQKLLTELKTDIITEIKI